MSIYDENLVFLSKHFPRLLTLINSVPLEKTGTEPAKNGSLTLVYRQNNTPYYLHSKFNPQSESQKILQHRDLAADHIIVMGLGLGYHLEKIMAAKESLSRVLVVEPEIEIAAQSLKTFPWHRIMKRPDFFFMLGPDLGQLAETLHAFIHIAAFEKVEFIELPAETRVLASFFTRARETLDTEIKTYLYDFKTRLAESYMVPRNILSNLPLVLKTRPIARLENAFPGTPGFIVSAGPSLDKNILYLKKIKNRGIFLAVDTALKPLLRRSLQPHFTAIGDPSHKNYLHLQGTSNELEHFVLAEAGVAHQVFKDFPGKIFTLSIGKPIERILEAHSEPLGEIEAWGSVISIALDAAVYMGLSPIIFVGQDFAFTGTRNHCRGTSWEEQKMEYSRDLDDLQRFEKQSITGNKKVIETHDIYGDKTYTSERLVLYKNYLARLVKKYPHVRFINATQGGIFSEIPHMELHEVMQTVVYNKEPVDFSRLELLPDLAKKDNIHRLIAFLKQTNKTFSDYREQVRDALNLIKKSSDVSPAGAFPVLRQLEEVQRAIYTRPENGEILEMWSASPIYYFLKEYKRIRSRELNRATVRKSLEIYEKYFRNIEPLLEDIVKQFEKTSRELSKQLTSSSEGQKYEKRKWK